MLTIAITSLGNSLTKNQVFKWKSLNPYVQGILWNLTD